ncbi:MAG: hypothetical protein JWM21_3577 [Acidobacteria bacterium]|nr:hypothetical protein [Acidobacteriota bacterium]
MNTRVRIIKRGGDDVRKTLPAEEPKTRRQTTRELVNTVQGWITERLQ